MTAIALLRGITMTLAFALELVMLGAFAWWGFAAAGGGLVWVVAALVVVAALATLWGVLLAPRAARPLEAPWRLLV